MSNVVPFKFDQMIVRCIVKDGEPWFVAAEVCEALSISNNRDAVSRLDDDEKADVGIADTSSNGVTQSREVTIINESGLYSLTLTSRKPEAKKFKKWVTSEVLPSIRKTGSYSANDQLAVPQTLPDALRLAADLAEQNQKIATELALAAPKAAVADRIANAEGSVSIREAANTLRVPERKFVLWLQQHDWVYRRSGHKSLLAYAEKVKAGLLFLKQTPITDVHTGQERLSEQVRITPLGLTELAKRLEADGMMERAA